VRRLRAGFLLALAFAWPARAGEIPDLSADAWISRVAEALRMNDSMSAHAHVDVDKPGRDDDFAFDMQLLRATDPEEGRRTVIEMREVGDTRSIVSELVEKPGFPLTSWYWDLQKRRWLSVKGLLPTDPWADTPFRYEDLWLTEPSARRAGRVSVIEEAGRKLVHLESEPYHYYQRVVTQIDPETALPVNVRFIDNTGTPIREQRYEQLTLVDGRPFPTVIRLRDFEGGGQTTVTFGEMHFGRRVPPSFFDLSVMDDRMRHGSDPLPEPPDLPAVRSTP
jgi:outer membrane lipoprotein-sorting protein